MDTSDPGFLKHLEFIQNAISRMARNSFQIKAWSVTLTAALAALGVNSSNVALASIALLPALVFWGLDAYYLRLEHLFRELYDDVRQQNEGMDRFSISTKPYQDMVPSWQRMLFRVSIMPLHSAIMVVVLVVIGYVVLYGSSTGE